jgi:hypothetical protein
VRVSSETNRRTSRRLVSLFTAAVLAVGLFGCANGGAQSVPAHSGPNWLVRAVAAQLGRSEAEVERWRAQRHQTREADLWTIAGTGTTCLADPETRSFSCGATRRIERQGLALGLFEAPRDGRRHPDGFRVIGVAPGSAAQAIVEIGDRRLHVPVREGAFSVRAAEPIVLVSFRSR